MKVKKQKGVVLILVVVVMSALLLLSGYFLNFIITEEKISQSHTLATQTYYLGEGGIQEAIWKIKNDPEWLAAFQSDPDWQATLTKDNPFAPGQSYQVAIQSLDLGRVEINATGVMDFGQREAQRVVKTVVFQPQGASATSSIAIFTDEDAYFSGSVINVQGAGLFANDDIRLYFFSNIQAEGKALAVDQIYTSWFSTLTATEKKSANFPPAPESVEMPQLDFDSADPDSLFNRATAVYTTGQFNQLLNNNPNLTLNGIIYVTGNAIIQRGHNLTVNGALVADGNINFGTDEWPFWESNPSLTINDPGSGPAGILSKRKIHFGTFSSVADINGLIYTPDEFKLDAFGMDFSLDGGILVRDFTVNSLWQPLTLNYNEEVIIRTLGLPYTAPVINIEHWEEEY